MDPDLALALLSEIELQRHLLQPVNMPTSVLARVFTSLNEQRQLITEALLGDVATVEQNRAGIAACRAALRMAGDPDPEMTIAFVGEKAAMEFAKATIVGPDEVHEAFFEQPPEYVVDMAKSLHPAFREL